MTTTVAPAPDMSAHAAHTPAVITRSNLRSVSRTRVLGLGIATVALGGLMILVFGLRTESSLETTIDFGTLSSAPSIPLISSSIFQVVLLLVGAGMIVAAYARLRRIAAGLAAGTAVVGLVLIAWALTSVYRVAGVPRVPEFHGSTTYWMTGLLGAAIIGVGWRWIRPRARTTGALVTTAGVLVVLWVLGASLHLNDPTGVLKTLTIPVAATAYVFGGASVLAGILLIILRPSRGANAVFLISIVLFILSFLLWVARGSNMGGVPPALEMASLLSATFIAATPLIYGSLSGVLCERSGVVNIAIEGQFLFGAMAAEIVASVVGPSNVGLIAGTLVAAAVGGLVGLLLAFMALRYRANQVIVGVVIVAFCTGMTTFLNDQVLVPHASLNQTIQALPIAIPVLSRIPILGPALFDQPYFVYLALALAALINFGLFRTRWGLRVRSVGEKPRASETVGINVIRTRYSNVILGGMVAGIGGATFTIGSGINFGVGMTQGYGFIALAIMIVGRWKPWGAVAGTLLFGFTLSLAANISVYSSQVAIPSQFLNALPYMVTIAVVAGLAGRVRAPAADGIPYSRE